jgi:hypothetical protein
VLGPSAIRNPSGIPSSPASPTGCQSATRASSGLNPGAGDRWGARSSAVRPLIEQAEGGAIVAVTAQRSSVRRWVSPADVEVVRASSCDPGVAFHTGGTLVVDGGLHRLLSPRRRLARVVGTLTDGSGNAAGLLP